MTDKTDSELYAELRDYAKHFKRGELIVKEYFDTIHHNARRVGKTLLTRAILDELIPEAKDIPLTDTIFAIFPPVQEGGERRFLTIHRGKQREGRRVGGHIERFYLEGDPSQWTLRDFDIDGG